MDDLSGVNWAPPKPLPVANNGQAADGKGNYYPALRPTPPISGRSTPLNILNGDQKPLGSILSGSKGSTPGNDSFANLVSFNVSQSRSVSLQEQQRVLQERKSKEEEARRRQFDSHFGSAFGSSISANVSGNATPNRVASPLTSPSIQPALQQKLPALNSGFFTGIAGAATPPSALKHNEEKEEDILAAFNSSAPVDSSSYMPPLTEQKSADATKNAGIESRIAPLSAQHTGVAATADDDDPFGLGMAAPPPRKASNAQLPADDDDVLGDLNRPVSEFPEPRQEEATLTPANGASSRPEDRAMAELIDMGFPSDKAKRALESTESGVDVQAAVGWLLNQAHQDSRTNEQRQTGPRRDSFNNASTRRAAARRKSSGGSGSKPAWMKEQARPSASHRQNSKSPAKGEKDPAQLAHELGNNLFKTANSLWKTGTKKLNQAVADFNTDTDPSQPKWMREANGEASVQKPMPTRRTSDVQNHDRMRKESLGPRTGTGAAPSVTDEALLLESGGARPQTKQRSRPKEDVPNILPEVRRGPILSPSFQDAPSIRTNASQGRQRDPRTKLSRQAVEEEAAQAYISPARRRKAATKPIYPAAAEPDLLFADSKPSSKLVPDRQVSSTALPTKPRPARNPSPPSRPAPPKRNIPPLAPSALSQSTTHRQTGTAAFKRGDYASATTSYTTALSHLPPTHPLTIPLLTNRALSHSKTGDPKSSIADTKTTLDFIGPSHGVGETIDLGPTEGLKPMNTYWGKAMTRQAEALEQLERWADAASAWRACVEAGVGGATSIAGRNRCEAASRPKPTTHVPVKKTPARPRPTPSALNDLTPQSGQSAEAVTRLRAVNAAADKIDDEKFALADVVDARVRAWRNGKEGNLRALLSSLEIVLWEGAGWKKVGMGEVIQSGRVKVVYMKGIAKVHPDKLPMTATTEQKMISAAVFATLNEAWEKFKAENGL